MSSEHNFFRFVHVGQDQNGRALGGEIAELVEATDTHTKVRWPNGSRWSAPGATTLYTNAEFKNDFAPISVEYVGRAKFTNRRRNVRSGDTIVKTPEHGWIAFWPV